MRRQLRLRENGVCCGVSQVNWLALFEAYERERDLCWCVCDASGGASLSKCESALLSASTTGA
jgi:hypothetical protein